MNSLIPVIAQVTNGGAGTGGPAGGGPPAGGAPAGGGQMIFLALMLAMVVFMFMTTRSQKKREQRKKEEMYDRLAKNDKVLTIGGAIGTVLTVKDNEVVLKVDESTNTKMTFLKTAIQRVITDDPE